MNNEKCLPTMLKNGEFRFGQTLYEHSTLGKSVMRVVQNCVFEEMHSSITVLALQYTANFLFRPTGKPI